MPVLLFWIGTRKQIKELVDLSIHQIDDKEYAEHMMEELAKRMGGKGEYAIITGGLSADNLKFVD